jgi:hypothetical protein
MLSKQFNTFFKIKIRILWRIPGINGLKLNWIREKRLFSLKLKFNWTRKIFRT